MGWGLGQNRETVNVNLDLSLPESGKLMFAVEIRFLQNAGPAQRTQEFGNQADERRSWWTKGGWRARLVPRLGPQLPYCRLCV